MAPRRKFATRVRTCQPKRIHPVTPLPRRRAERSNESRKPPFVASNQWIDQRRRTKMTSTLCAIRIWRNRNGQEQWTARKLVQEHWTARKLVSLFRMNAVIERAEQREKSQQDKLPCNVPTSIFPDISSPWHTSKKTKRNENGGNIIINGKPFWARAPQISPEEMDSITSDDLPMTAEVFIEISSGSIVLPTKTQQRRRMKFDPYANMEILAARDIGIFDNRSLFSNTIRNLMMGANQGGVPTTGKVSDRRNTSKKDEIQIMPPPETFTEYTRGILNPPEKAFEQKPYIRSNKGIDAPKAKG